MRRNADTVRHCTSTATVLRFQCVHKTEAYFKAAQPSNEVKKHMAKIAGECASLSHHDFVGWHCEFNTVLVWWRGSERIKCGPACDGKAFASQELVLVQVLAASAAASSAGLRSSLLQAHCKWKFYCYALRGHVLWRQGLQLL